MIAYSERSFYKFNDYYKFSGDEILSILEQECRLFEKVLDEYPDSERAIEARQQLEVL